MSLAVPVVDRNRVRAITKTYAAPELQSDDCVTTPQPTTVTGAVDVYSAGLVLQMLRLNRRKHVWGDARAEEGALIWRLVVSDSLFVRVLGIAYSPRDTVAKSGSSSHSVRRPTRLGAR